MITHTSIRGVLEKLFYFHDDVPWESIDEYHIIRFRLFQERLSTRPSSWTLEETIRDVVSCMEHPSSGVDYSYTDCAIFSKIDSHGDPLAFLAFW